MLLSKRWRPEFVLRLFAIILFSFGIGGVVVSLVAAAARGRGEALSPMVTLLLGHLSFQVAGIAAVHLFLRWHGRTWRDGFGLDAYPFGRAVMVGIVTALVMVPISYGLQWVSAHGLEFVGVQVDPQSTVKLLLESSGWTLRAYLAAFAVLVAPIVEECLFRGILFVVFRDAGWPRLALFGTAVAFGAMHANLAAFVPLTVFGLVLARLYEHTGTLVAPITAHACFNLVPFILVSLGFGVGETS